MRRPFLIMLSLLIAMSGSVMFSQTNNDLLKERLENAKLSKKELNEKASKAARTEAKKLNKAGWTVAPGALPIEKQLDRSYSMQYQYDYDGSPMFIMAEGMSIGGSYDAAKMQALELAKQNLAGQIQTEITALVEQTVSNKQMDEGDAASITESVLASKNFISQSISRVIIVVEAYRDVKGRKREVLIRIAYNQEMAKAAAKKAIRKELEQRGDELHDKLDGILGW